MLLNSHVETQQMCLNIKTQTLKEIKTTTQNDHTSKTTRSLSLQGRNYRVAQKVSHFHQSSLYRIKTRH